MIHVTFTHVTESLPEFKDHSSSYGGEWYSDWVYILTRHGEIISSRLVAPGKIDEKPVAEKYALMAWKWTGLSGTDYFHKSVAHSPVVAWAYKTSVKDAARSQQEGKSHG